MTTIKRGRGVAAMAVLAAACMAGTLVPTQAAAQTRDDFIEYPAPPPPDGLRETPALAVLTDDANDAFKYAMATVAANQDPAAYREGTVEATLAAAFAVAPADMRDVAKAEATRLLDSAERRETEFGRYGRLAPAEFARLGFDGAFDGSVADREGLRSELQAIAARIERESVAEDADHQAYLKKMGIIWALPQVKELRLRLEKVKCVEETDMNWTGSDEIAMGGVQIDNEGETKKISKFAPPAPGGFDQGETYTYSSPGKTYAMFSIKPGAYPRKYVVTMLMAEEDDGGFSDILSIAFQMVKAKVQQEVDEATDGLTGSFLDEAINEALSQAAAWLISSFENWIMQLFNDDLFEPVTVQVKLPSRWAYKYDNGYTAGWDNLRTGTHTSTFKQDTGDWNADGIYKANIHWELVSG